MAVLLGNICIMDHVTAALKESILVLELPVVLIVHQVILRVLPAALHHQLVQLVRREPMLQMEFVTAALRVGINHTPAGLVAIIVLQVTPLQVPVVKVVEVVIM